MFIHTKQLNHKFFLFSKKNNNNNNLLKNEKMAIIFYRLSDQRIFKNVA